MTETRSPAYAAAISLARALGQPVPPMPHVPRLTAAVVRDQRTGDVKLLPVVAFDLHPEAAS